MSDPTSRESRELSRGEALRELSRAQRQLLAALASLDSGDPRDRAAAAQALDHAEARLAHSMAEIERLDAEADDDTEPIPAVRREEGRAPTASSGRQGAGSRIAAGEFSTDELAEYLAQLSALASQCATDVDELREMMHRAARLEAEAPGEDEAPAPARQRRPKSEAADDWAGGRRRELLKRVASELGDAALADLSQRLVRIEAGLQDAEMLAARAASEPARTTSAPVPGSSVAEPPDAAWRVAALRLGAVEDRLAALERRIRWLESDPGAGRE